jgi:F0F1-type ATP synthase gamma subunit
MSQLEQLKAEIKDEEILYELANAFTEVSASKIGVLKKNFEKNQGFFQEISQLYQMVKSSSNLPATASKSTLAIAMTTNNRFYGVINLEVMNKFLSETQGQKFERLVVGKIGASYLKSMGAAGKIEKMVLTRDVPPIEEFKNLLEKTKTYQQVLLFYPQFKTIYTQTPAVTDIAHSPTAQPVTTEELKFISEPELPKIIEFFETQIRAILLKGVLLEMELSVTASRLQAMSRSQEHAREVLDLRRQQLNKAVHSQINARLLESLSRVKQY